MSKAKVHIDVLPALGEVLGMEAANEEAIPGPETGAAYSVKDLLNHLCTKYRRLGQIVFDCQTQKLTGQVVIFLNGRSLELVDGLETKLKDGDSVTFIPFIEGG